MVGLVYDPRKRLTKNRVNPVMLSAVALGVYAIINGALSPSVAFTALAIFSELEFVLSVVPELTTQVIPQSPGL